MNALVPILIVGLVLVIICVLALLALVIVGIHGDERRMGLSDTPDTCSGALARRVLGVHGSQHRVGHCTRDRTRR